MTAALILDFDGVCTRSPAEQRRQGKEAGGGSSPGLADIVRPEAVAAMRAARAAGLSTVILSNELDRRWLNGLEITASTDHVVVGADNGIFKPDRRAFQRCLLLTGSVAERTVLVDDHSDNVIVADSLGMNAILFEAGVADAMAESWATVHRLVASLGKGACDA